MKVRDSGEMEREIIVSVCIETIAGTGIIYTVTI
jgi:hypothetical protein